ncbi:iron-containing alcohol dehydrogenase, partial [Mycobacterium tuberculosis]|nr:iron-containing alcohol dehydrogenase [Mycobacterium tuberculosis]
VKNADFHSREKMHNASTIAGMAFANAFLGISHSMAHKIGAQFHTIHGRTNAILLPYVIRYNGTRPAKTATWPKYNYYRADEKYQDIARMLGLPASTPEEGVESFAKAVKNADFHSREKMHNASTIAGMAFANAFLGISH